MSSQKSKRAVVEAGEASESDEGESELCRAKFQASVVTLAAPGSIAISGLNRQGTSIETCSVSSLTQASGSITAISQQEWPTRPVPCRALVEANSSLAKGIQEAAALPYTVAIKEIDDIALDLVRGQQLVDDVYRVLESVSESLQYIEWEADELRAQGTVALPVPPPRHGYGGCHAPKPPTCPEQK